MNRAGSLGPLPYSTLRLCAAGQVSEQLVSGRASDLRPQAVALHPITIPGKGSYTLYPRISPELSCQGMERPKIGAYLQKTSAHKWNSQHSPIPRTAGFKSCCHLPEASNSAHAINRHPVALFTLVASFCLQAKIPTLQVSSSPVLCPVLPLPGPDSCFQISVSCSLVCPRA